jgi:hypothetical protein
MCSRLDATLCLRHSDARLRVLAVHALWAMHEELLLVL